MEKIKFGIIGHGWRADFYLRIARELPERFEAARMLVRREETAAALRAAWGVAVYRDLDAFLADADLDFVVVSVPWDVCPVYIRELAARGVPVLAETPPAPDLAGLTALYEAVGGEAKVQVAEQLLFQPMHAARIALARSGKLGDVSQAQVSVAHGYHGISLIRQFLGVRFEEAVVSGQRFVSPIVEGPGRQGPPREEIVKDSSQDIVFLRFGDKLGVLDFTGDQYFSWIRRERVLVRGPRGEIIGDEAAWLQDFRTPVVLKLRRIDNGFDGNVLGFNYGGILLGAEWLYVNPFVPGRLTDDEVAVATSLAKMGDYARGGPSFYSLAEASQDHYLNLLVQRAIAEGATVTAEKQAWHPRS
ncbi:Oxidoreductase family, NAD-binding Rossmann fold [Paenibacillus sp. UNC496MF]|uniref:Gfo/Idh/MocA family protein n=1 Tax=Paenibacillus sp. UNC496MF TaxID=1502753 RepID=UPI0008ED3705|nr:Gfo/Idh/MocA family oxidoreductase [Paenibacillus sp. UNC496MF]SFJ70244.1 Oxidoreductase family, NAD-binding Rossmann fold [Paenibacillus sp. UNC496MF]